ncbi:hypothetical protein H6G20_04910 [Desertifilum sp. FACHB-1129]|uniref:DUF4926 domain-containing protein n=2 Tax=Desertifilaceae TaxID=1969992 RepID=A0A1E5QMV8_9CYAN|nr:MULTISPECIES: hypothetical protein [unclassified Desertifilum]MDA0208825.1 hypothetical protein [Cyanobacteria bacterium FC1]OEJ76015.1 hypothetical protein BH720_06725 [Desertifilum tharense IPPAS B-1220]MBD2311026.1 hypothetical protein [Desertifilum sp. FACHB-1129]MBD2321431.1 hypothetical protein [Desertifilum sp. FACHB-866]MBD2331262.1 hypothetical protein [Desertifilum sp. FACHB-868]
MSAPKYRQNQQVLFLGGKGTIKKCRPDSGLWTYVIEMELGPEPEMGRVGPETTIVLDEPELQESVY